MDIFLLMVFLKPQVSEVLKVVKNKQSKKLVEAFISVPLLNKLYIYPIIK